MALTGYESLEEALPMPTLSQQVTRIAYSVEEFAEACGISRDLVFDMIKDGDIKSLKAGGRRLIPASAVSTWLESAA